MKVESFAPKKQVSKDVGYKIINELGFYNECPTKNNNFE